jgi:hypothetical protein
MHGVRLNPAKQGDEEMGNDKLKMTAEQCASAGIARIEDEANELAIVPDNLPGGYGWAVYNFSDWDLICTAPGRDTGYEQGEESGADSVRRGMLKLLGFDKATVKVLDDYGVARPTNI